jgi:hypothetical protein
VRQRAASARRLDAAAVIFATEKNQLSGRGWWTRITKSDRAGCRRAHAAGQPHNQAPANLDVWRFGRRFAHEMVLAINT